MPATTASSASRVLGKSPKTRRKPSKKSGGNGKTTRDRKKLEHVPVFEIVSVEIGRLTPARINGQIYKPVNPDDPGVREKVESIREVGIKEPLVVTFDNVIMSGHQRHCAAQVVGLTHVPVRYENILSTDPNFEKLLVIFNQARDKDPAERIREQLVLANPDDCYAALQSQRAEKSKVRTRPITLDDRRERHAISEAKHELFNAIIDVLNERRKFWAISDRAVHYGVVSSGELPLIHSKKLSSRYRNDKCGYKAAVDMLVRGRIAGLIPWEAICDETRPVTIWNVNANVSGFVAKEIENFLTGYWRDLMIGQPHHIEVVGEKMTVESIVRPVAMRFCIPYTIGRGFSSLPPRKAMADRYKASGKDKLVILFLADFDPEGMCIPESFARSMRDDFGIEHVHPVRVGLNAEQVRTLRLPPNNEAKETSPRFKRFAREHGRYAYELEAVRPEVLQQWLTDAVDSVIDVKAFNEQVAKEKEEDAPTLRAYRESAVEHMKRLT